MKVWCVKHRGGFCATKGNKKPDDAAYNVDTVCDHVIVMPFGTKYGKPDCQECLEKIKNENTE